MCGYVWLAEPEEEMQMRDALKIARSASQQIHDAYAATNAVWLDEMAGAFHTRYYLAIVANLAAYITAAEELEIAIDDAEAMI